MTRKLLCLAPLVLGVLAGAAQAQEPTRAGTAQAEREAKATTKTPPVRSRVEWVLSTIEDGVMNRAIAPPNGFGVRIGGIEQGSALALGPSWRAANFANGNVQLHLSAARSIAGDTGVDAALVIPQAGTHRLRLSLDASAARLPQERFFGMANDSLRSDETAFGLQRDRVVARATVALNRWFAVSAAGGVLNTSTRAGRARTVPSIDTRFSATEATGLGTDIGFTTLSVAATLDARDVPGNPRAGGRYHLAVSRYGDRDLGRYSFTQLDAEVEQHLSFWKRQRVLTLRALLTATAAGAGQAVPFHLQPTLGGSRVLRGFVTDRFRDRNALAVQAEYGWDVLPFLSAVAFVEGGTVSARWQDLTASALHTDYGIGFRFGSARTVAFRTDVAFGSGEGTRLTMRFNHAF